MDVDKATRSEEFQTDSGSRNSLYTMDVDKATRSDTMDVVKATWSGMSYRAVKPLYSTERKLRKGAECFKVARENRADQIRAKKALKDKTNMADVTRSVKQLSLAQRTVARAKQVSLAEPTAATGGKFSRTNDSSVVQQVPVKSKRKFCRVCLISPPLRKAEKIKLEMAFLEKVVSCPAKEAYLQCFSRPGMFTAKLTKEEFDKVKGMEEVLFVDHGFNVMLL